MSRDSPPQIKTMGLLKGRFNYVSVLKDYYVVVFYKEDGNMLSLTDPISRSKAEKMTQSLNLTASRIT